MKRRGFLATLLGLPAAPVAARVLDQLPKGFSRGLVESEPKIDWEAPKATPMPDYMNCCSVTISTAPPYVNFWKEVK